MTPSRPDLARAPRPGVRAWVGDATLKRLLANTGYLLGGNMGAALAGLASLSLSARALGPEQLGVLVLISGYVTAVDYLFNFQSWHALIRYGAGPVREGRRDELKALVKFTTLLDVGSAVLATLVAALGVVLFGAAFGLDDGTVRMTALYSLAILFNLAGTPTGVLRLFNRFRLYAAQLVIARVLKVAFVTAGFLAGGGLWAFLVIWLASEVVERLLLLALGWRQLRLEGVTGVSASPLRGIRRRHGGIWEFTLTTNLQTAIKFATREADIFVLGAALGPAASGGYRIAKSFAGVFAKFAQPVFHAAYPAFATLSSAGDVAAIRRLLLRVTAALASGCTLAWVAVYLIGQPAIRLTVGADYLWVYPALLLYLVGSLFGLALIVVSPVLLALGRTRAYLLATVAASAVYLPTLVPAAQAYGMEGAAASWIVYNLAWAVVAVSYLGPALLRVEPRAGSPAPEGGVRP